MKKTLSLKEAKEFQKVLNRGKWYGGNYISSYILSNGTKNNFLGLGIGKKVGKATKRNRVKRVIRAAYMSLEEEMKVGYTILFVWRAKAKFAEFNYQEVKKDIEKAFYKAGLIK